MSLANDLNPLRDYDIYQLTFLVFISLSLWSEYKNRMTLSSDEIYIEYEQSHEIICWQKTNNFFRSSLQNLLLTNISFLFDLCYNKQFGSSFWGLLIEAKSVFVWLARIDWDIPFACFLFAAVFCLLSQTTRRRRWEWKRLQQSTKNF